MTGDGYNLVLFRLIADTNGEEFEQTKGPLLLTHGAFSDTTDWLTRLNGESSDPAVAVQLALKDYDVFIAAGRSRQFTRSHQTLNYDDPADRAEYHDYSFEDVGLEDVPAFIDAIVEQRR